MQQLLCDKAASTNGSFIRELFLQRMPGNIHMVLASTVDAVSLEELATLADKVIDVAAPSAVAVSTPKITLDVDLLHAEVTRLKDVISVLTKATNPDTHPAHTLPPMLLCAGTTGKDARKCGPPCYWSGNNLASR